MGNEAVCFAADDYFMNQGKYEFDPSKLGAAHERCRANTESALQVRFPIVLVHNTFTTQKEITPYQDLADKYQYKFVSLIVENRHGNKNVHGVPEEIMEKMTKRFEVKL